MKLLLLNANTSEDITARLAAAARARTLAETEIVAVGARFGARYISSRAAAAIAGHAALDLLAEHVGLDNPAGFDAAILACFGDPGLLALREASPIPVIGMAEASILTAAELGGRFAILTGGRAWVPMLTEFVAACGLSSRLAAVRALPETGLDIARAPDQFAAALASLANVAVDKDGADSVILGGAGLVGLAGTIQDRVPVPLLDCLACALGQARAIAASRPTEPGTSTPLPAPVETRGLSASLAALFGR